MRYKVTLEAPTQMIAEIFVDANDEEEAEDKALEAANGKDTQWRISNDREETYVAEVEEVE